MPRFRQASTLILAVVLATTAPAAPWIWGSEGWGVEPVGMTYFDVGLGTIVNYGNSDADNLVELTFIAPAGYVLDVSYPGCTGWWFSGDEWQPFRQTPEHVTFQYFVPSGGQFNYELSSPAPPAVPVVGTLEAMSQSSTEFPNGVPFNTLHLWLPAVPVAASPTQAVGSVSVVRAGAGHVRLAFANGDGNAVLAVADQPDFTPWPGRTYDAPGLAFAAAPPHGTGVVTVAGLAPDSDHTIRLYAANTAPGRQPYYVALPPALLTVRTLPLGARGDTRPLCDAIRVDTNGVALALLELDTRLWQRLQTSTDAVHWSDAAALNATTSTAPPRAASTNWTGAADGPVRFYRVRAEW